MDGIILVNKEKDYTSRDVVNIISKCLNTKKVGHFGTLDPLATGLLVIGVGKYTKFQSVLETEIKEYQVTVLLGKATTTYDITGDVIKESNNLYDPSKIKKDLLSFKGKYLQEVPIYSAVKVKGKKLYEYARNNILVELPKKEVEIYDISNIKFDNNYLSFTCLVSKGCYIRSLINDLSKKTKFPMCMSDLCRTKVDLFSLNDSYSISDIKNNNYKFYDLDKILKYSRVEITKDIENLVLNGHKISNIYHENRVIFTKDNEKVVLYEKDQDMLKKVFYF